MAESNRNSTSFLLKEKQVQLLNSQNAALLKTVERLKHDARSSQLQTISAQNRNRALREENFQLECRTRAATSQICQLQTSVSEKSKRLRIVTDQNSELLRLLETEEAHSSRLNSENKALKQQMKLLSTKYNSLLAAACAHEDVAKNAAREGRLRADEIGLVRSENKQLKQENQDLRLKAQVEVESLQAQLQTRKEKQYQLLTQMQTQDHSRSLAENQITTLEDKLHHVHVHRMTLDAQLQAEVHSRQAKEKENRNLEIAMCNLTRQLEAIQRNLREVESHRCRVEMEARDSGEQLSEMAEKVFQILERLKLAELGKVRAMDEVSKKECELEYLSKRNATLLKEANREAKGRLKIELDTRLIHDQLRALKKHNSLLAHRCHGEITRGLLERKAKADTNQRMITLASRLAFMLEKMQSDAELKVKRQTTQRKLEAQFLTATEEVSRLQSQFCGFNESNHALSQALRLRSQVAPLAGMESAGGHLGPKLRGLYVQKPSNVPLRASASPHDSIQLTRSNSGIFQLQGTTPKAQQYLAKHEVCEFIYHAQHALNSSELLVGYTASCLHRIILAEGKNLECIQEMDNQKRRTTQLEDLTSVLKDKLHSEEDAKRRVMLKYVCAVIHPVTEDLRCSSKDSLSSFETLNLSHACITDEELTAIVSVISNSSTIREIQFQHNLITDKGARLLASLIANQTALTQVDVRGNNVSRQAVCTLAEAMQKIPRFKHVHVDADGRIEALSAPDLDRYDRRILPSCPVAVDARCIVDCRDNPSRFTIMENTEEKSAFHDKVDLETEGTPIQKSQKPSSVDFY